MSEERTTAIQVHLAQRCLCCENTREVPRGFSGYNQFVCDECKEAIAFLKDFIKSCNKASELLKEMEEPSKNVHPL